MSRNSSHDLKKYEIGPFAVSTKCHFCFRRNLATLVLQIIYFSISPKPQQSLKTQKHTEEQKD